jgi:hypothetical protein
MADKTHRLKEKLEESKIRCTCGKWATPVRNMNLSGYAVRGWECSCGEKYINPVDANYVLTLKKLEREKLEGKITKTGNSYALRLPKKLVDSMGYEIGDTLEIKLRGARKIEIGST